MGTVTIAVGGVIVLAEKIPPIDIINIPIAVIIDARSATYFGTVRPDIAVNPIVEVRVSVGGS